jgi:hypothetical protein
VSIRLLNRQTRNPSRSCISRSTSQSHSLSDSISQRASLFTYHLVRAGYSPVPSSRFTLTTPKTLVSSPTDYVSSGSGSEHRTVTYAELATGQIPLKSSRTCHRHVTIVEVCSDDGERTTETKMIITSVTDLQGPPSGRTQSDKIRDLKSLAKQYARDRGSCDDTRISYLEYVESEAEADWTLARMIAG